MAHPHKWMPVYWADLWNKTRNLSAVEQAAYYNLLGSMWMEGGSLPNDNARLQRMSRVTEKEWRTVSATVIAYFECRDGRFYQKRLSEEYEKAVKAYTARSDHMTNVNNNRKQSQSTVTVNIDRSYNSHSAIAETEEANASSGAPRPRSPKGTRLANDWQPSEETRFHGRNLNLTDAELAREIEQFRQYFLSPDATRPIKKDWEGACKRWLSRSAPEIVARRARAGKSAGNRQNPSSVLAALGQNLAAIEDQNLGREGGISRRTAGLSDHETDPGNGFGEGDIGAGKIVDADEFHRVSETPCEAQDSHVLTDGNDGGYSSQLGDLRRGTDGLSGGHRASRPDHAGQSVPMVAELERPCGQTGAAHTAPPHDDDGLEIPSFLKRPKPTEAA